MKKIARTRRALVVMAVAAASFMAVSAAPAMGAVHWSDTTHGIKLSGSLTVSSKGETTTTCTFTSGQQSFMGTNYALIGTNGNYPTLQCGASWLEIAGTLTALSTTSVEFHEESGLHKLPWGELSYYTTTKALTDFVNGSGSTMSTLAFSNDQIGVRNGSGNPVYATGTVTVTNSSGGLLTLLP